VLVTTVGQRQEDFDGGAGVVRDDVRLAAMLDRYALNEREAEARPRVFCREEGVEYRVLAGEAGAVILDTERCFAGAPADDDANARTSAPFARFTRIS
jgi:hypothetical protein